MRYEFRAVTSCEMCGSTDADLMGLRLNGRQGFRPKRVSGIAVSVKKCRNCELVYSDPEPIPENIDDHYGVEAEAYFPNSYFESDDTSFDSATAKRLAGFSPGAKALDIGAGVGKVVRALRDDEWDAWGLEPSAPFIRWRRSVSGSIRAA